jgi:hypothetical protein
MRAAAWLAVAAAVLATAAMMVVFAWQATP